MATLINESRSMLCISDGSMPIFWPTALTSSRTFKLKKKKKLYANNL